MQFLTLQDVFQAAVTHMITQGHRAMLSETLCGYLTPNGDRCAIGGVLPQEVLDELTDSSPAIAHMMRVCDSKYPKFAAFVKNNPGFGKNISFLHDLQRLHDNEDHWKSRNAMHAGIGWLLTSSEYGNELSVDFMKDLDWSKFDEHVAQLES